MLSTVPLSHLTANCRLFSPTRTLLSSLTAIILRQPAPLSKYNPLASSHPTFHLHLSYHRSLHCSFGHMLDSIAYPHLIDRIVDFALFAVRLQLRLVNKKMCARVDKLLWTHIAYGKSKRTNLIEFCEPFAPWNRLPEKPYEPPFHLAIHSASGDDRLPAWRHTRVVDSYDVPETTKLDFGEATVRSIRPTAGCFSCHSLVEYFTLPASRNIGNQSFPMSPRTIKRYVMRILLDVTASEIPAVAEWLRADWVMGNPVQSVAIVFEVVDSQPVLRPAGAPAAAPIQRGLLNYLDITIAKALRGRKQVRLPVLSASLRRSSACRRRRALHNSTTQSLKRSATQRSQGLYILLSGHQWRTLQLAHSRSGR